MNTQQPEDSPAAKRLGRRNFVRTILAAGTTALITVPATGRAEAPAKQAAAVTVQQVIDLILKSVPGAPFPQTVDTIKAGDPNQPVTGIVTTMFATAAVIEKAARLGANFIIAHEPTFYSHTDATDWLKSDAVYEYKRSLLEKHKITVWRFHDAIHVHKPDGVLMGALTALGWEQYYNAENPGLIIIPPARFEQVIAHAKNKLKIPHVKVIGGMNEPCSRIALLPGAAGGRMQLEVLKTKKPDLLIVGELNEWETSEYIRDLRHMGTKTCLLVLGHVQSEEPGLEWLVKWLQPQLPQLSMHHIPSTDAFSWA